MGCGNSTATSAGASQGERGGRVAGPGTATVGRWGALQGGPSLRERPGERRLEGKVQGPGAGRVSSPLASSLFSGQEPTAWFCKDLKVGISLRVGAITARMGMPAGRSC